LSRSNDKKYDKKCLRIAALEALLLLIYDNADLTDATREDIKDLLDLE